MLARAALGVFLVGAGVETWMMGREWDEEELKAKRMVCPRLLRRGQDNLYFTETGGCTIHTMGSYEGSIY